MSDNKRGATDQDPRVKAALEDYLDRVDRGETVDRDRFLEEHHEIADELRSFLATEREFEQLAAPVTKPPADDRPDVSTQSMAEQGQETMIPRRVQQEADATGSGTLPPQFGRYRVLKPLGSGAMGTVYLAEDTQLERQVALKTPSFDEANANELLERFYREARSAATLRHTNICPVYDVGEIDGRHYISMAYIKGRPLSAYIQPDHLPSERNTLLIVRKIALGLHEAHKHGIIHRDLKPGNVMIDEKSEPIIMDFGLARKTSNGGEARLTQSGMIVGSPAYMSPEQVEGEPDQLTPAADQYSLGVILYEMLTGQLPFRGSITAVIGAILTKQPTPIDDLRKDLDPRIAAICAKMMHKEAGQRFSSLKEAADAIRDTLSQVGGAEKSPPAKSQVAKKGATTSTRKPKAATPSITASNVSSLLEAAQKSMRKHDYEGVVQLLETLPERKRTDEASKLLAKARGLADEVAFLIAEIEEADRLNDNEALSKKADELLQLKPRHHRALQIKEELQRYGRGRLWKAGGWTPDGRRIGEGSWIPWIGIAVALVAFGLTLWAVTVYLRGNNKLVKIEIDEQLLADGDVTLHIDEETVTIAGIGETINLEPGEYDWELTRGDELIVGPREFVVREDGRNVLRISISDSPVIAADADWTELFNGRDLTGWVTYSDGSPPDSWRVADGAIRLRRDGGGDIRTVDTYSDFELEFDWKIQEGGNSGVIYRAQSGQQESWHSGPEYQILDDDGHSNGNQDITSAAAIYNIAAPQNKTLKPVGEWNTARIVARGNRLEHWLNGVKVVQAEIDSSAWKTAVSNSNFRNKPQFARSPSGHIVLQDHGTDVWFRNLRIRELISPSADSGQIRKADSNAPIEMAVWSPDGTRIATAGWDGVVRVWNAQSLELEHEFPGHEPATIGCIFANNDSSKLITVNRGGKGRGIAIARLWNLNSGNELNSIKLTAQAIYLSRTMLGDRFFVGVPGGRVESVTFTDGSRTRLPLDAPGNLVTCFEPGPSGRQMYYTSYEGTICVYDINSWNEVRRFRLPGDVNARKICFSPDGGTVAVGADNGTVFVFDSDWNEIWRTDVHEHAISSLTYTPDGQSLISGCIDRSFIVWDAESGEQVNRHRPGRGWVTTVEFSPSGRELLVTHTGKEGESLQIWPIDVALSPGSTAQATSNNTNADTAALTPGPTANSPRWSQSWKYVSAESILTVGGFQGHSNENDAELLRTAGSSPTEPISNDGPNADHSLAIRDEFNLDYHIYGAPVPVGPKE